MRRKIATIVDVAEHHLCLGCGVCAYVQPDAIEMIDVVDQGRRPRLRIDVDTAEAVAVCPGVALAHDPTAFPSDVITELVSAWGPVLEIWEGFAVDPQIRLAASSGGIATALALHCIESDSMAGVVHIAARDDVPYLNHTVFSTARDDLLAATGSRYAPASPCDRLDLIEQATAPCVFIGKPCDVAAVHRARKVRPALDRNVGLTVAMFCAGTPSTLGTLEMIARMGIADPSAVRSVRYRGNGWPGVAEVVAAKSDESPHRATMSYDESWGGILQRHRQWRCRVCADHTGEFADIAVGDPWYREIPAGEPGRSLVLVRSERGRRVLAEALHAGAVELELCTPDILLRSQPNLLDTRGAVWGRIIASRTMGMPAPRYRNMPMFPTWWRRLSLRQKVSSIGGTVKRIHQRRMRRRAPYVAYEPP